MSKRPTVIKLIPSSVLRKVLVMVTLVAFAMYAGNVSADRAGREDQLMVVASVKTSNWRVDRRVKLKRSNVPPIAVIVELVRPMSPPALCAIISPVT